MIDTKQLRDNPDRFRQGCQKKNILVDIDRVLELDANKRTLLTQCEETRARQRTLEKELGQSIGKLMGSMKTASPDQKTQIQAELDQLKKAPIQLKAAIRDLEARIAKIEPDLQALLLSIPQPPDGDVPIGTDSDHNVQLSTWNPAGFNPEKSFRDNKGFAPTNHLELGKNLDLFDFARGVNLAGTRSYILKGDGMRLHQAILRLAFDFMIESQGFTPISVPVLVRENAMVGTGFFPGGKDQTYIVEESRRGDDPDALDSSTASGPPDLFLTGTGEVGLMGMHAGEILDEASLPLCYTTVSTCFRREAGAAGKDTAGLFRIHQFDKVEQVVICKADEAESRAWHTKMIGFVQSLLQQLELPYRLLQCCTGDLGAKNADMIDIECWMPGRGSVDADNNPAGAYAETHSASRLYDYQCRRLNLRYRQGGDQGKGPTTFCHSLNNTVAASPRILIPIMEMYQNEDGTITIPKVLQSYMGGRTTIR